MAASGADGFVAEAELSVELLADLLGQEEASPVV